VTVPCGVVLCCAKGTCHCCLRMQERKEERLQGRKKRAREKEPGKEKGLGLYMLLQGWGRVCWMSAQVMITVQG